MSKYDFSWLPKRMYIRTRIHTLQEGWDLCCAIMRKGYEGVQNDSSRYNDLMLRSHFLQNGYCWVGIWGSSLYILNTHDKVGRRKLKDIGKCKFIRDAGLEVHKEDMKRSKYLKRY